ncbi:MAG: hypothetical protein JXQ76_06890 [Campylobacterales bacterium]|nr:hypothetical protein [Campylobacterales bacterium]
MKDDLATYLAKLPLESYRQPGTLKRIIHYQCLIQVEVEKFQKRGAIKIMTGFNFE